ncbi:2-D-hydroxyacid dehydrogenase [Haladaptatus paucihalophilus DX253]|uniref:2-D-hydroxyacid dehydrogenase n=1 Tax=Haladaptatus paucihalophilus DX253 TaxID=797209 RepID=E7QTU6_HALPU|nr:D-2-hydroxyacid dehydrogenase [Haladaptatus paucihalophilus]EFW92025.1 2-D-hydroxyacid dehydrogenase [Haladaptatus paucihalophilus DX253]SHK86085.1 D-2-hydroxyacid dehydrogenase (NADP+) [Haladaptatus paucihalophilus DX253]
MQISHLGIHESVEAVFPPEQLREELSALDPTVAVVGDGDRDALADCDALVTFAYRESFLDADLEWIHSIQAGYDRFPLSELEEAGIILTNSTGIHGTSVGETVLGTMLEIARRLHRFSRQQVAHEWTRPDWDEPFTLQHEPICVVGLGTLGQGIAKRADAIGMHVTGVRRSAESVPHVRTVYANDDLHEAISDARFVALATPLTDETEGLMGEAEFDAMRDDAYFVNVARGDCADQDALVAALQGGDIAGAALDVFEEEPLPEDSPLWDMDDVIVTPHAAAAEVDYYRHIAELVRENAQHIDADEELTNRVV